MFSLTKNGNYEFLEFTRTFNDIGQVIVPTNLTFEFENRLSQYEVKYFSLSEKPDGNPLKPLKNGRISYEDFYSSQQIEDSIKSLMSKVQENIRSPFRVKIFKYGNTYRGKPLNAVRIGLKTNNPRKVPIFLVDGGIHGNEWISPASVHRIIENLIENRDSLKIMKYADIILAHCVNRDGYDYSIQWTQPFIIGRKNLMPSTKKSCILSMTIGTNINRNFDWYWNTTDESKENPCGQNFKGDSPHSAPETRALLSLMQIHNVKFYFTIHSFGNYIMYPYGNSHDTINYLEETKIVATAGKDAVEKKYGQEYKVGSTIDILYNTIGSSKDYAAGNLNIPISIILEIGGRDLDFQPNKEDIHNYTGMAWTVFYNQALVVIKMLSKL